MAGYGDGRARRGGLAWRATAIGECAEAAERGERRRRAGARRRPGVAAGLGWRGGGWSRSLGFISMPGWSWASNWASILSRPACKYNFKNLNWKVWLEMLLVHFQSHFEKVVQNFKLKKLKIHLKVIHLHP